MNIDSAGTAGIRGAVTVTAVNATPHRTATVPPTMLTGPSALEPGESWTYRCPHIIHGHDRTGQARTLPCAITTQGGRAGLAAHLDVVHGQA